MFGYIMLKKMGVKRPLLWNFIIGVLIWIVAVGAPFAIEWYDEQKLKRRRASYKAKYGTTGQQMDTWREQNPSATFADYSEAANRIVQHRMNYIYG